MSVNPVAPYRLPRATPDGVMRRRGGVLERIVVEDDQIVLLRAAQPGRGADATVVMGAWADDPALADRALDRWRRTLGVDADHRPFLEAAWHDPLLGPLVRARPWLRPSVRYRPHEALMWAITEQLIEYVEAARIQRQLTRLLGTQCARTGLRDAPTPRAILDCAPARIESFGLSGRRTLLLREVCRHLERGLDLDAEPLVTAQRRLRAIPGLGAWTLACMALRGQGDPDASPSGDLGLLKAVGRLMADGRAPAPDDGTDPTARDERERLPLASEQQVHDLVSRYAPWRGYAAEHLLRA
ncbi:MAG: DNA-3-methyladenine glycosylase 2 family protein [Solirubrobacteraceae bacterium]|nr:DNA-3-methyladenine glycosylase 2 family protein [Solirubrobacteraceae bacterium]